MPAKKKLVVSVTSAKTLPGVDVKTDVRLEVSVGKLKARSLPARMDRHKVVRWDFLWKDYLSPTENTCVIKVKKHNPFTGYSLIGSVSFAMKNVGDDSPDEGAWMVLTGPEKRPTEGRLKCAIWWSDDNSTEGAVAGVADIYDDRDCLEQESASHTAIKSVNLTSMVGALSRHPTNGRTSDGSVSTARLNSNEISFGNDTSMTAIHSINASNLDNIERNYSVVESLPVPNEVHGMDDSSSNDVHDGHSSGYQGGKSIQRSDRCSITAMKSENGSMVDDEHLTRYISSGEQDINVVKSGAEYDSDRGSITAIRSININNLDDVRGDELIQYGDVQGTRYMEGTKIGTESAGCKSVSQPEISSDVKSELTTLELRELEGALHEIDSEKSKGVRESDLKKTIVTAAILQAKVKRLEKENQKLVTRVHELESKHEEVASEGMHSK
eukprot:CFRG1267T1